MTIGPLLNFNHTAGIPKQESREGSLSWWQVDYPAFGSRHVFAPWAVFVKIGMMKSRNASEFEIQLLLQLVVKMKALEGALALGHQVLALKCPCGAMILRPTPVISNLKDRQRGLLKSCIKRHLRTDHTLPDHAINDALNQAFHAA
jgi:hypothetical protein